MPEKTKTDFSKLSPWEKIGMALSYGAMGIGGHMAGQNFLGTYQQMQEQQAEQEFKRWQMQQQQEEFGLKEKELGLKERELKVGEMATTDKLWADYEEDLKSILKAKTKEEALTTYQKKKNRLIKKYSLIFGDNLDPYFMEDIEDYYTTKKAGWSFSDLFKTTPSTTPQNIPLTPAEQIGQGVGQMGAGLAGYAGTLPSRALGAGGQAYNLYTGALRGATGIPFQGIPPPYLDLMTRGQLFNIPQAVDFYKQKFQEWQKRR